MSLNKGDEHDADDQKLYCDLRFSIVDCYLSVLHGISDGGDNNNPEIQNSVLTIYQYIESLVNNQDGLQFDSEILSSIIELYIDIVDMFLVQVPNQVGYSIICTYLVNTKQIVFGLMSATNLIPNGAEEKRNQLAEI